MPFDGRCFLALPFLGRLLVKLTTTKLGQHAGFLAGTFEATQSCVEIFIFFYTNAWHTSNCQTFKYKETRHRAGAELRIITTQKAICKAKIGPSGKYFSGPEV